MISEGGWLHEWMSEHNAHRTLNFGKTVACPVKMRTADVKRGKKIDVCPVCGQRLSAAQDEDQGNLVWAA